ncbi:unnamed protein product [Protopolystoma xenopodis]|uniref:Uncharacterized protein n=1 Tax=Protopolystoma xenopodis TaxID=117903 RepID=A0A448XIP9_9PLAT|nr:unnamed protein product [Protopolystoma xenopodis]
MQHTSEEIRTSLDELDEVIAAFDEQEDHGTSACGLFSLHSFSSAITSPMTLGISQKSTAYALAAPNLAPLSPSSESPISMGSEHSSLMASAMISSDGFYMSRSTERNKVLPSGIDAVDISVRVPMAHSCPTHGESYSQFRGGDKFDYGKRLGNYVCDGLQLRQLCNDEELDSEHHSQLILTPSPSIDLEVPLSASSMTLHQRYSPTTVSIDDLAVDVEQTSMPTRKNCVQVESGSSPDGNFKVSSIVLFH